MIRLREPESLCEELDTDVCDFDFFFLMWIAFCWDCEAFEHMIHEVTDLNLFFQMKMSLGYSEGVEEKEGRMGMKEKEG